MTFLSTQQAVFTKPFLTVLSAHGTDSLKRRFSVNLFCINILQKQYITFFGFVNNFTLVGRFFKKIKKFSLYPIKKLKHYCIFVFFVIYCRHTALI